MYTLPSMYLLLCWSGLYFGIKYYETLQVQREEALRASTLAREAQVKMLRYQLNPHFLFNTLNAVSTLVPDGQGEVANQAIGRLSDCLRYTLDQDPMKEVTLRQELDALNLVRQAPDPGRAIRPPRPAHRDHASLREVRPAMSIRRIIVDDEPLARRGLDRAGAAPQKA